MLKRTLEKKPLSYKDLVRPKSLAQTGLVRLGGIGDLISHLESLRIAKGKRKRGNTSQSQLRPAKRPIIDTVIGYLPSSNYQRGG